MNSGAVISFDPQGRYGLIHPAAGGPDVCVLRSAVERAELATLCPGLEVDYDLTWDVAGTLLAINLRLRAEQQ